MDYLAHVLVLIAIYVTLAHSLNLLAGYTGLVSLAHASLAGLGAYTSALVVVRLGAPFSLGVLFGMLVGVVASSMMSVPSQRMRGDLFIFVTFAFQIVLSNILNNWSALTRGPLGLSGIPPPTILGLTIHSPASFAALAGCIAVIAHLVTRQIVGSPLGRILRATRGDDIAAEATGKPVRMTKVIVFAVSAAMAACGGGVYAHYITFIDPASFGVMESVFLLAVVVVGGAGSLGGPVVGASLLIVLPEMLRFVGFPANVAGHLREVSYGGLLLAAIMLRPRGLVGKYGFGG